MVTTKRAVSEMLADRQTDTQDRHPHRNIPLLIPGVE